MMKKDMVKHFDIEKNKCNVEHCRLILGRYPQPDYCDLCEGMLLFNEKHSKQG